MLKYKPCTHYFTYIINITFYNTFEDANKENKSSLARNFIEMKVIQKYILGYKM